MEQGDSGVEEKVNEVLPLGAKGDDGNNEDENIEEQFVWLQVLLVEELCGSNVHLMRFIQYVLACCFFGAVPLIYILQEF